MFGYVRPFKGEMLVKEYDAYKGVYCQLCRALGKYYGFPMRLTLSYDCTLYAMLALNQRDADVKAEKKRCCCNPMKKCTYVCPANEDVFAEEAFHKAAALSIIMTVHKLRDTAADEDGLKAFGARVLRLFARRAMKKASNDYPFMADAVQKMMDDQADAEHAKEISIDRCSAPTAEMLQTICAELGSNAGEKGRFERGGGISSGAGSTLWMQRTISRTTFCNRNSTRLFKKLGLESSRGLHLLPEERKRADEECNAVLNGSLARLLPAVNLLPSGKFTRILENTFEKGLPEMQREILFLHIKKEKRHD